MSPENFAFLAGEKSFFETLLDNTCSKLHDKQAQYTVRRLQELDVMLKDLESELDVLVNIQASNKIASQRFL